MLPCHYCEGYASAYCAKCGYSSALYADLTGQYEYLPSFTEEEAEAEAERIMKALKIGQEYDPDGKSYEESQRILDGFTQSYRAEG